MRSSTSPLVITAAALLAACGPSHTLANDGGDPAAADGARRDGPTGPGWADAPPGCANPADPDVDLDGDGFTPAGGDCNECDRNANPGAIEVATPAGTPPVDEDCSGVLDDVAPPCDTGLALDDADPAAGAHAIELCQAAPGLGPGPGLLSARYARADGSSLTPGAQTGLEDAWGDVVVPRRGARMLVLSTGNARVPGQPDECGSESCFHNPAGTPPAGFPQDTPGCEGETYIADDVALEVRLRAPTNATGLAFDFAYYTFEYPEWVCSEYNDQFVALVSPPPAGSIQGNISFDSASRPVSVNIAFFGVCSACPQGDDALAGTGYHEGEWNEGGSTGWLRSQAPITGGAELTLRFVIWDTGDQNLDSAVLLDNFTWIATAGEVPVVTGPVID